MILYSYLKKVEGPEQIVDENNKSIGGNETNPSWRWENSNSG